MLRNLSQKLRAKFPVTTLCYSMERIAQLDDAFSDIYIFLNGSKASRRSITAVKSKEIK